MNLLHGHFLTHNVPSCRPHLGIPVNWNLSVPCYERDLLCRLFYIPSCPQLKSFLSNTYHCNECMTLSCTPNREYTFCSLYFAFVPEVTSLSFHSLSLSLLCTTGLLSQSSDNLSCPNGLPKHPLQYNLFLLALTSTSSFFGYILFIILPGSVIVPQCAVAATVREELCEVQEAAHPHSGLMITTPSLQREWLVKVPSEHTGMITHFSSENPAKRPGVRHSQMALLLVIRWQIYTAGARPLLMLLLDGEGLKAIPTITSSLRSVRSSTYWAPSQHRCPANTIGLTNKEDIVPFPKRVPHHE